MQDFQSSLMPPTLIDQAERNLLGFIATYSDSMPLAIDQNRVIRYCDPRLRALLEYGWQEELVNEEGVLIDALLPPDPPDLREWHAGAIAHWFSKAPRILEMHSRRPVPIMTKHGNIYHALIKLVPYEPIEQGRRPLLDKPRYHRFGVAFITLLPRSWSEPVYAAPSPIPADRIKGQSPELATESRAPNTPDIAPRGTAPLVERRIEANARGYEPYFPRNWADPRSPGLPPAQRRG